MELRDLNTFHVVLALGSMTRAARQLHVVQSAVSQAVKRLEQEYGVPLLERSSNGVRPTEAGAALGRHADRILTAAARVEHDMASFRGLCRGTVSVGLMPTATPLVLGPLVRRLREAAPDITLHVEEAIAPELLERLRVARLDLAVVLLPIDLEEFPVVEAGSLPLTVIMPPDHRLSDRDRIPFRELDKEPWVSWPRSNPGRRWLDYGCRRARFRPRIVSEVDSFAQLITFVEEGIGLALVPQGCAAAEIQLDRLSSARVVEPESTIRLGYATDPGRSSRAIGVVRDIVGDVLRRLGG